MTSVSATRQPFNRVFRAMVSAPVYGDCDVVVRRMVGDRVFVEMPYAPPLLSMTFLHFQHVHEDGEISEILAECEVAGCHWQSKRSSFTCQGSQSPDRGDDWVRIIELRIIGFTHTIGDINPEHIQ